ncbi:MAG: TetR family transcriptional regulator [Alphaproteobacteria bacterium]|nr:TetR family transcriptional regulator [Alphaproteobacteria bacterium]
MTRPPELPTFPAPARRDRAVLAASRDVLALYLHAGHTGFSIKELADHTGLSERTFYRYFPRKEDALRPYLVAALEHVVAGIAAEPADTPLVDVLADAHGPLLDLAVDPRAGRFFALVRGTERLHAVWLALVADAELAYAAVLAPRLGVAADSVRARLAAAVTLAAARLALEAASDPDDPRLPSRVYTDGLALVGPDLFHVPARPSRPVAAR